jgi:hypothetical protein
MSEARVLAAGGTKCAYAAMRVPKALQFIAYLRKKGVETGTELIETRRRQDSAEIVVFEVRPERPQDLAYDIRRVERLAAVFGVGDESAPGLFALRSDFPLAPHVNQTTPEFPRSLCLYEEAYEEVRLKWTPANFLRRVHYWLSETAKGTLHAQDQPLEPFILAARNHLILPADFFRSLGDQDRLLHIVSRCENEGETTFIAKWVMPGGKQPINVAIPVGLSPQVHGIIRHAPRTLFELDGFCRTGQVDLVRLLADRIRNWLVNKPFPGILDTFLFLVLVLPKTRTVGGPTETWETRGFLMGNTVQEVGAALGAIDRNGSTAAYVLGDPKMDATLSKNVGIEIIQVHLELGPETAALMNGVASNDVQAVAIGSGAIGSQILNNFVRAGFGKWSIIDPDTFLPHNAARHLLPARAVGMGKAVATAGTLDNTVLNGSAINAIPANILAPGKHQARVDSALAAATLICDFSASVAVSRFLARSDAKARHVSAFLTPSGSGLIVAAEDIKRKIRLDWLEMLHYRAILGEGSLNQSLQSPNSRVRYGNSCRDISARLAQDDVAIWSGMASKVIRRLSQSDDAALEIYSFAGTGIHPAVCTPISKVRSIRHGDWTIRLDEWFVSKLFRLRGDKLPNETGGILLGHFDTHARICSLVDVIPSPPDSGEWPTSYIRGVEGLVAQVGNAETLTLGQTGYVGEWHSHPRGCPALPSRDDLTAYAWLCDHMNAEALPGVMLIVADRKTIHLVGSH